MEYIKYIILCLGFGASASLMLMGQSESARAIAVLTVGFSGIAWLMER